LIAAKASAQVSEYLLVVSRFVIRQCHVIETSSRYKVSNDFRAIKINNFI
jgi:hypothetical protein